MDKVTKCLNEWNAVIEALGQGKQTILIRKYQTKNTEFLLFPTIGYANDFDVFDKFQNKYSQFVSNNILPFKKDTKYEVKYFARVETIVQKDLDLDFLLNYTIWSKENINSYLGSKKPYIWVLRVYSLDKSYLLSKTSGMLFSNVEKDIPLDNIKPVLSDKQFSKILNNILSE